MRAEIIGQVEVEIFRVLMKIYKLGPSETQAKKLSKGDTGNKEK